MNSGRYTCLKIWNFCYFIGKFQQKNIQNMVFSQNFHFQAVIWEFFLGGVYQSRRGLFFIFLNFFTRSLTFGDMQMTSMDKMSGIFFWSKWCRNFCRNFYRCRIFYQNRGFSPFSSLNRKIMKI